jgi:hypothetical protein
MPTNPRWMRRKRYVRLKAIYHANRLGALIAQGAVSI